MVKLLPSLAIVAFCSANAHAAPICISPIPSRTASMVGATLSLQQELRARMAAAAVVPTELQEVGEALLELTQSDDLGAYFQALLASSSASVCVDPDPLPYRGYYDPENNLVAVVAGLTKGQRIAILAHELRHLDQYRKGYKLLQRYDAREYVRQTYAVEGDAQAWSTGTAWLMRQRGNDEAWLAVSGFREYGDIAQSFEQTFHATDDVGLALLAAFRSWYRSPWRLEKYCLAAKSDYFDQLDKLHAVQSYDVLPVRHFDSLCLMLDGRSYGCERTNEIALSAIGPCRSSE